MLRKRRICPASSRMCGFNSGNFSSRTEYNSPRLAAAHATELTPAVCRRNAVGICTVIGISFPLSHSSSYALVLCARGRGQSLSRLDPNSVQRLVEIFFKLRQPGCDRPFEFIDAGEYIGGL